MAVQRGPLPSRNVHHPHYHNNHNNNRKNRQLPFAPTQGSALPQRVEENRSGSPRRPPEAEGKYDDAEGALIKNDKDEEEGDDNTGSLWGSGYIHVCL